MKVRSPYIVQTLDVVLNLKPNNYYIMEFIGAPTVAEYLSLTGSMATHEIIQLVRHMTMALIELNSLNIVHRDIKPTSIFFIHTDEGSFLFKLTGFAVSRFLSEGNLTSSFVGTYGYMAPEAFTDKYDARGDIWSLGMVVLECALGHRPLRKSHYDKLIVTKEIFGKLTTILNQVDIKLRNLLQHMLTEDPNDRFTAKELLAEVSKEEYN